MSSGALSIDVSGITLGNPFFGVARLPITFPNSAFSAFSYSILLKIFALAAKEPVREKILHALEIEDPWNFTQKSVTERIARLNDLTNKNVDLQAIFGIWVSKSTKRIPRSSITPIGHLSPVITAKFPTPTFEMINKTINQKTHGLIPTIVTIDELVDCECVALNTLYMSAKWNMEFESQNTDKRPFRGFKGVFDVDMMHQKGLFMYSENENCQIIELSYQTRGVSMIVILPKSDSYLVVPDFFDIDVFAFHFKKENVFLHLPKFRAEGSFDLSEVTQDLGMEELFTENLLFGKINLSKAIQRVVVVCDEKGTNVAPTTGEVSESHKIELKSEPELIAFNADHPFLYSIVDNLNLNILFSGIVLHP